MKRQIKFQCMVALWAWMGGLSQAPAGVLFEDSFDYPDGPVVGAPDSTWIAHSQEGNGPVRIEAGRLRLRFDQAEDVSAPLSGAPIETNGPVTALYAGFTLRAVGLPNLAGSYFAHFRNNTSAHRGRLWISRTNAVAGRFRLGIGNNAGASATSGPWPLDLELDRDYRVVVRYRLASGMTTLWVDPRAESDSGVTASDPPALSSIHFLSLRQSAEIGTLLLEDLRVSDRFDEVAGQTMRMDIEPAGGDVEISWPAANDVYLLESASNPEDAVWSEVSEQAVMVQGRWVVRLPARDGRRFFRLLKAASGGASLQP